MIDVGTTVNGKYRLVRLLGDGGMGSVYEAQHAVLGTRVAVKVLHPELLRRTGLVERFLQEARVAAQIRSPHVVQVTDVDRTSDGLAYIVMELLEGEPLSSVLDRQHRLPVSTACEHTIQILEALEAAHALGVIHRDLKPENVFVTFAGGQPRLKLIDFGIAKARRDPLEKGLTVAGVVMGTAEYMAPEQARSADKVDARADLYAVGVMLYEMIAGSRPVVGDDARVIALKVERGEAIPLLQAAPDTPREVAGLVHHAMAPRLEARFATATEMRLALLAAMAGKRPRAVSTPDANGAGQATTVPVPAMAAPAQPAGAGGGSAGSGTLKNIPARDVPQASPVEPDVDTVRAPPLATALAPPIYAAGPVGLPANAASGAGRPARRRGGGRTAALIALPLLLGAGIVGLLVMTGAWSSDTPSEPSPPPARTFAAPPSTSAPATGPTSSAAAPTAIPTLVPTRPSPVAPPRPPPSAHPPQPSTPDAGPSPAPTPTLTPPVFPSGLPTALPFPTTLPSGFPTALPSGFPTILPWPPAPAQPMSQPSSTRPEPPPSGPI